MSSPTDTAKILALRLPQRDTPAQLWRREVVMDELDYLTIPPSPIRMRIITVLCALFASALIVCAIAKVDIYAIAHARVRPAGGSKVIQPLATSRVSAIHVANGDAVRKGDVLVQLDPTESTADRDANTRQYNALVAEIARRAAANAAVHAGKWTATPAIGFNRAVPADVQARERQVLAADLAALSSQMQAVDTRIAENETRKDAIRATIAEQERLLVTLQKRLELAQASPSDGRQSRENALEAERSLAVARTELADLQSQLRNAEVTIHSARSEKQHAIARFIAANTQAMANAEAKRDEVAQTLVKAAARFDHTRLIAPIDGVVEDVAVTTIGQVVGSGQHLLTIVPNASALEVEALVSNKDIAFVEVGQRAVLKLDALPFTRYGTISGRIVRVSHDAINTQAFASTDGTARDTAMAASMRGLVFAVTVALDRASIVVDDQPIPVRPGMTGRLEIRTGERRAIEYFLSPVLQVASEAGHER